MHLRCHLCPTSSNMSVYSNLYRNETQSHYLVFIYWGWMLPLWKDTKNLALPGCPRRTGWCCTNDRATCCQIIWVQMPVCCEDYICLLQIFAQSSLQFVPGPEVLKWQRTSSEWVWHWISITRLEHLATAIHICHWLGQVLPGIVHYLGW